MLIKPTYNSKLLFFQIILVFSLCFIFSGTSFAEDDDTDGRVTPQDTPASSVDESQNQAFTNNINENLGKGPQRTLKQILKNYDYLINVQRVELPSTPDMMMVGKKATEALRRGLINNIHDDIRSYCARVLYELRDRRAIPELRIAMKDRNSYVRVNAIKSLGVLGDVESIDGIIKATKDKDVYVRAEAYLSLGKLGDQKGTPYIIQGLKDTSDYVRSQASIALLSVKDLKYESELLTLLSDESFNVRENALTVLSRLQSKKAIPRVLELLEEDSIHFSTYAIGLYKIDKELTFNTLQKMLEDDRGYIRLNVCWALGKLRIKEAVPLLLKMLKDPNEYVRGNAIIALGNIQVGFNFTDISKMLSNETPRVRENILKALSSMVPKLDEIKKVQVLALISKSLEDRNYYVKKRAALILAKHNYLPMFFEVLKVLNVIQDIKRGGTNGFEVLEKFNDKEKLLPILKRTFNLHYENQYVKRRIISMFSKFHDDDVKNMLKESYYFGDKLVKRKVLSTFGDINDSSNQSLLEYSLWDSDIYTRLNAAYSLFKLGYTNGNKKGYKFLMSNLFNGSKTLQENIIYLFKVAKVDCSKELEKYLDDDSVDILDKINIAEILLHYDNSKALSFFIELLNKNNYFNLVAYNILESISTDWVIRNINSIYEEGSASNIKNELHNLILDYEIKE